MGGMVYLKSQMHLIWLYQDLTLLPLQCIGQRGCKRLLSTMINDPRVAIKVAAETKDNFLLPGQIGSVLMISRAPAPRQSMTIRCHLHPWSNSCIQPKQLSWETGICRSDLSCEALPGTLKVEIIISVLWPSLKVATISLFYDRF